MNEYAPCPFCAGRGVVPPLRTCANEACGREFRWTNDTPKPSARIKGVKYCSSACARAQTQRTHRRRKANQENQ